MVKIELKKWKIQERNLTVTTPILSFALVTTANQRLCHSWAGVYNIIEEFSIGSTCIEARYNNKMLYIFLFDSNLKGTKLF